MKVFVAGGTGAIGTQLLPQLAAAGHDVIGMTRSPAKTDALRALGARPVVADAFDPDAVARRPDPARRARHRAGAGPAGCCRFGVADGWRGDPAPPPSQGGEGESC